MNSNGSIKGINYDNLKNNNDLNSNENENENENENKKDCLNSFEIMDDQDEDDDLKEANDPNFNLFNKISFAFSGMPYVLTTTAHGVFANKYLLDVAGLKPVYVSIIMLTSMIIGGLLNPLTGYFVNKTRVTKCGKMKPWVVIMSPLCAVAYTAMWYSPANFNKAQLVIWFTITHTLYQIFISGLRIPHTSMTMYLSYCKKKRESATMLRMFFELSSILIAIGLQLLIIGDPDRECIHLISLINLTNITTTTTPISNKFENITTTHTAKHISNNFLNIDFVNGLRSRYLIVAMIFSFTFIIGGVLMIVGVHERTKLIKQKDKISRHSKEYVGTYNHLKLILTYKPFLIFCFFTVAGNLAITVVQTYMQLYFTYSFTAANKHFKTSILITMVATILLLPLYKYMMKKIDDRYTYTISNFLIIPLLVGAMFFNKEEHVYMFLIFCLIAAPTFTANIIFPFTMLPKCIDQFYLKHKEQPDAIFYTFHFLNSKVCLAIYLGICNFILGRNGYQANLCAEYQPPSVNFAIRMIFSPSPIILVLLSSFTIFFYPLKKNQPFDDNSLNAQKKDRSTNETKLIEE